MTAEELAAADAEYARLRQDPAMQRYIAFAAVGDKRLAVNGAKRAHAKAEPAGRPEAQAPRPRAMRCSPTPETRAAGKRCRAIRTLRGLTQKQVASAIGYLKEDVLSYFESGHYRLDSSVSLGILGFFKMSSWELSSPMPCG